MQIVTIAAVAENRVIGDGKDIPWHIPEDWDRFRELTTDNFVVMGRSTFESIGKPLPNRTTVVVTRQSEFATPAPMGKTRVFVAHSIEEALHVARTARGSLATNKIFIAGGGEIYEQTMDVTNALDLTIVKQQPEGTVLFPEVDEKKWYEIRREEHETHDYVKYVPIMHTERLTLIPATVADVEDWKVLWNDERIWEHDPERIKLKDDEDALQRMRDITRGWDRHSLDLWTIRRTEDNEFLGMGGVQRVTLENGDKVWMLRFQLRPEVQGNGYTPEMIRKALDEVKKVDREARVRALIRPKNAKSIGLVEEAGLKRIEERQDAIGLTAYLYQGWVRALA